LEKKTSEDLNPRRARRLAAPRLAIVGLTLLPVIPIAFFSLLGEGALAGAGFDSLEHWLFWGSIALVVVTHLVMVVLLFAEPGSKQRDRAGDSPSPDA
jgi:hypothetical protein